jgi:hypothetical protein
MLDRVKNKECLSDALRRSRIVALTRQSCLTKDTAFSLITHVELTFYPTR